MISLDAFVEKCNYPYDDLAENEWDLPCFAYRVSVTDQVATPELIKALIDHGGRATEKDILVFSVTQKDRCWKAWVDYAKDHPRTFKVVEGGSIHGRYMCRMYIYTKPVSKRKYGNKKGK